MYVTVILSGVEPDLEDIRSWAKGQILCEANCILEGHYEIMFKMSDKKCISFQEKFLHRSNISIIKYQKKYAY